LQHHKSELPWHGCQRCRWGTGIFKRLWRGRWRSILQEYRPGHRAHCRRHRQHRDQHCRSALLSRSQSRRQVCRQWIIWSGRAWACCAARGRRSDDRRHDVHHVFYLIPSSHCRRPKQRCRDTILVVQLSAPPTAPFEDAVRIHGYCTVLVDNLDYTAKEPTPRDVCARAY
jgi:hypothetical protein